MFVDFLSMFLLSYYFSVLPMVDSINNFIQIFNEILVMLVIVTLFLFTDYVEDPETRYRFGGHLNVLLAANVGINLIVLVATIIIQIKKSIKRALLKRKAKKEFMKNKVVPIDKPQPN